MSILIASCQAPEYTKDLDAALAYVVQAATQAHGQGAKLLCFPEAYLQGYLRTQAEVESHALDLNSKAFESILVRLSHIKTVLVIGLIEVDKGDFYNTAVVIQEGTLLGCYRKTHLLRSESIFKPGTEQPVFTIEGLHFGINICNDLNYSVTVSAYASKGIDLLVCPCQNMLPIEVAETWRNQHHISRAKRAKENRIWLLSADVTGLKKGYIPYGPTSVISPKGSLVKQYPLFEEGILYYTLNVLAGQKGNEGVNSAQKKSRL